MKSFQSAVVTIAWMAFALLPAGAELAIPANPTWKSVADEVYLQDTSTIVRTEKPIVAAAVFQGVLYTGDDKGVNRLEGSELKQAEGIKGGVSKLKVLGGVLYAATAEGLQTFDGQNWKRIGKLPISDMAEHLGGIVVASGNGVYRVDGEDLTAVVEGGRDPVLGVASYSGTIYVRHEKRIGLVVKDQFEYDDVADWGDIPMGATTRDILTDGGRLLVATDEGLSELRGMTWYNIRGEDGLCYEDTNSLTHGFADDIWIGTMRGAIRNVDGEYQYYGYERWIPNDKVNAIAVGEKVAYIATDGGLGIVGFEPYTLRKKAAYYERFLNEWGMRRLGFTHSLNYRDGEWLRSIGDNDVGFTCHYLAAKCFEYAVTKDPAARAEAVNVMTTVKWSEEITSVPGFPARCIWVVGDNATKAMEGSGGLPAEWNPTPDGLFEWKGDTSSDETDAHLYAVSLFLELVAEGPERDMAIQHISRVFGHIVDNGFVLRDTDGQPTRWARWDPAYLDSPYGMYARGLNGMEALSYMTTAYHFTKEDRFKGGKDELLKLGRQNEVVRQKLTFHPGYYTDFDDRLAFLVYYPLIRYETDPDLKSLWLRSIERSFEVKRMDSAPWYSFIYSAVTGNEGETAHGVKHLREWPLDLVSHPQFNSHRDDIRTPDGYRSYAERIRPFSPREVGPKRHNRDWTVPDSPGRALGVTDPSGWLEVYWMGRYYGLIEAPATTDPDLISVPERGLQLGAKPYEGPQRPQLPIK